MPGGGGNWGGSFLAVPTESENQELATELVEFLTSADGQIGAFEAVGNLPSNPTLYDRPGAVEGDERVLQRRAGRRRSSSPALPSWSRCSSAPSNQPVRDAVENAMRSVEAGERPPDEGWKVAVVRRRGRSRLTGTIAWHARGARATHRRGRGRHRRTTASESGRLWQRCHVARRRRPAPPADPSRARPGGSGSSRWDVRYSPYVFVSPYFILFAIFGAVPVGVHALGVAARLEPARRAHAGSASDNYTRAARRRGLLQRADQHSRHVRRWRPSRRSCWRWFWRTLLDRRLRVPHVLAARRAAART